MDETMDKRRCLEKNTDVIFSNLPGEVIHILINYLPFRDAARTSILSREWRFDWLNVPNLVFDRNLGPVYSRKDDVEAIINRVLYNHKGPIDKFIIDNFIVESHPNLITDWIRYLSNYEIREFTLNLYLDETFLIPFDLFTFKNLTHLTLSGCEFKPSCLFKGFAFLIHLHFDCVTIVPHVFCSFISKCPLLKYLRLVRCTGFGALDIDAPRLKTFHFSGNLSSISLKHTSLIQELFFDLDSLNKSDHDQLMNSFSQLSSLTRLTLNGDAMQWFLIADVLDQKLPHNLNHLKLLNLLDISFDDTLQVRLVVCLLRSSPDLESLRISSITSEDDESLQFLTPQERCNISLNRLKEVYIECFKGLVPEMEVVELILVSAAKLEKLEIGFVDCDVKTQLQIVKEFERLLPPSAKIKRLITKNPLGLAAL